MRWLYSLLILCFSFSLAAQERAVDCRLLFGEDSVRLGHWYFLSNKDSVRIDAVRFYLTNEPNTANHHAHLVDFSIVNSTHFVLNDPVGEWILGTDSLMNVSGALQGDLDPMHGMYWAWHSGYINVKIEGVSMKCPTRQHRFQFHLGGFVAPNATAIPLQIPDSSCILEVDMKSFFQNIDFKTTHEVMSPGPMALSLSQLFAACFHFKVP